MNVLKCILSVIAVIPAYAMQSLQDDTPCSFGTSGKEEHVLEVGREADLFQHSGSGCLTHMWF
ncbi:MAG: hypothetical protein BWY09_01956 [Candidatus Hydrogenedentes bacterium ADurb.Bin179]|nr:MAG: hypothetical protein BWY09_01956 [Candidatus Hydrogenedentes bacterium ADurb.Bin179]